MRAFYSVKMHHDLSEFRKCGLPNKKIWIILHKLSWYGKFIIGTKYINAYKKKAIFSMSYLLVLQIVFFSCYIEVIV